MFPGAGYLAGRLREVGGSSSVKRVEEVDECHREPGIIHGYRHDNCSIFQAVVYLFNATNETVNFWTHFIPTVFFLWQFVSLSSSMRLFDDHYLFPFVCYMGTSCAYPLMSCIAHAFSCLSVTATHVCFFLDYAALSLYSWGVAVLYFSYAFPRQLFSTFYSNCFLHVAAANAVISTVMACTSRFVKRPSLRKALRLCAFMVPYLWDSAPLVWRLVTCQPNVDSCSESGVHHVRQFMAVAMASFFYATHIPERLAPGCFDIVGHSHNLLHLFGIVATHEQIQAALADMQGRRYELETASRTTSPVWATIVTPTLVILNVLLVITFTYALNRFVSACKPTSCDDIAKKPL